MTIIKQYKNPNNNGQEKVKIVDGNKFYISSDWGTGFCDFNPISKQLLKIALTRTNAPQSIMQEIFGE